MYHGLQRTFDSGWLAAGRKLCLHVVYGVTPQSSNLYLEMACSNKRRINNMAEQSTSQQPNLLCFLYLHTVVAMAAILNIWIYSMFES